MSFAAITTLRNGERRYTMKHNNKSESFTYRYATSAKEGTNIGKQECLQLKVAGGQMVFDSRQSQV